MSIKQTQHHKNSVPFPDYPELIFVEDRLLNIFSKADTPIQSRCLNLLQSGGKRFRPLLTLYSGMCFGPLNQLMIYAAVAAELIHMASLTHDDVIDNAATRRGQPTTNVLNGNQAAVLTGDYLFAEAFQILSTRQLLPSMKFYIEAIQQMCSGEVTQAMENFVPVDQETYFKRISQKTGVLLAACCKSGASLSGASAKDVELMAQYGIHIGYAYQIIDDILDFTGNSKTLGKPLGADISNGNITLPLIFLLEHPIYGSWLREILQTKIITSQGRQSIREALAYSGSLERAFAEAKACAARAKTCISSLPPSHYKSTLLQLADSVLERNN